MVVRYDEMVAILSRLCDEKGLRVAVTESLKGGAIAGLSTVLGGLMLGPPGLAFGGAFGGVLAYLFGDGKFKPVSSVIANDLSEADKQQLFGSVSRIINELDASDAMQLYVLLAANPALKARVIQEIVGFMEHQLKLTIL